MTLQNTQLSYILNNTAAKNLPSFLPKKYDHPRVKYNPIVVSTCRVCEYYHFQGRGGGNCQMYNCEVKACWKGCPLGVQMFTADTA